MIFVRQSFARERRSARFLAFLCSFILMTRCGFCFSFSRLCSTVGSESGHLCPNVYLEHYATKKHVLPLDLRMLCSFVHSIYHPNKTLICMICSSSHVVKLPEGRSTRRSKRSTSSEGSCRFPMCCPLDSLVCPR